VLLFLGAALESAAFLGFLVPGETIVVSAGVLASFGILDLPETLVIAVGGALTGDNAGYWLGRRLGRPWLERVTARWRAPGGAHGAHTLLLRVDELFERHGGKAVLVGRFIGFLRAMAPFAAGSSRMPYARFVVYNGIGATAWGIAFVLLGFFLGTSWTVVERWFGRVGLAIGMVVLVATVWWLRRAMRRATG
jgi:membrane protein DedA with SNARE-associated domain